MTNRKADSLLLKGVVCLSIFVFINNSALSQKSPKDPVKAYWRENQDPIIREFMALLSIPNVASDTSNIRRNAVFIMNMMQKRKISNVQLLEANFKEVPPSIFGEVVVPGATQTLMFYAHYDGQPVNPDQWAKGLKPFVPQLFSASLMKNGSPIPMPEGSWDLRSGMENLCARCLR
jgi:hypothetical protein